MSKVTGSYVHVSLAAVALISVYLLLGSILPAGGFYIGDQGVKLVQVEALSRTGSLNVGDTGDKLSVFRPEFNKAFYHQVGESYMVAFSPAYALLVLPFYQLCGLRGVILPSILGAALAACAGALIGSLLGVRRSWVLVLVIGLASPLAFYALVLWEHALSTGLLALATYLALRGRAFGAGLLSGLAVWFRPEAYLFAPALAVAAFVGAGTRADVRLALRFGGGFLAGISPWWAYNLLAVGTPLGLSAGREAQSFFEPAERIGTIARYLVPMGQIKWLLLIALVLLAAAVLRLRRRSLRPSLWLLWGGVAAIAVVHLLGRQGGYSLTDLFPFGFAALSALAIAGREHKVRALWVLMVGYVLTAAAATLVHPGVNPGGQWGQRYLIAFYPPFAVLAWLGFESQRERLPRLLLLMLLLVSLFIQTLGLGHLGAEQRRWTQLNSELTSLEPGVVVTAVWWLPQIGAPTLQEIQWHGITDIEDLKQLPYEVDSFWWIWTNESTEISGGFRAQSQAELPSDRFWPMEKRTLSTRELEAVLYRVIR